MGFFSWNCKGCNESIKAPYDIPKEMAWQNEAVLMCEDGTMVCGDYDGYGRVGHFDIGRNEDAPELWHKKCWEESGQPMKYSGASDYAEDQGFFYGDDCDVECFEVVEDDGEGVYDE